MRNMSQYMMDDPLALGAEYKMGNHKTTCLPFKVTRQDTIIVIAIMVVSSLGLILALRPGITGSIIIICSWLLLFIVGNWEVYRKRAMRLFIYDEGLIHFGRQSFPIIIYWRNVQSFVHKVKSLDSEYSSGILHSYIISCADGIVLKIDDRTFPGLNSPMVSIEEEITRFLFPVALNMYQMDHVVSFGPLTVTQEGVCYKEHLIPWSEVKGISEAERIRFKNLGKRLTGVINVNSTKIINMKVLKMLIEHIISEFPPEA